MVIGFGDVCGISLVFHHLGPIPIAFQFWWDFLQFVHRIVHMAVV